MQRVAVLLFVIGAASACTDGKDNVLQIGDLSGGKLDISFSNVIGQTYDSAGAAACYQNKEASLNLPGTVKLVSGIITVKAANDLKSSGDILLTLKKNSILVGTVCLNGVSKNAIVPDEDCHADIFTLFGADFTTLLSTPGTYDLAQIEAAAGVGNVVALPTLQGSVAALLKGEWQTQLNVVSNGKQVANLAIPGNSKWVYVD